MERYRSIALELAAELPDGMSAVIAPTARGDLIAGIAQVSIALREAGLGACRPARRGGRAVPAPDSGARRRRSGYRRVRRYRTKLNCGFNSDGPRIAFDPRYQRNRSWSTTHKQRLRSQPWAVRASPSRLAAATLAALTTLAAQGLLGPGTRRVHCDRWHRPRAGRVQCPRQGPGSAMIDRSFHPDFKAEAVLVDAARRRMRLTRRCPNVSMS